MERASLPTGRSEGYAIRDAERPPHRAKSSTWNETLLKKRRAGQETRPYNTSGKMQQKPDNGRTLCAPTAFQENHSRTGQREGQAPPLRMDGEIFRGGEQAGGPVSAPQGEILNVE